MLLLQTDNLFHGIEKELPILYILSGGNISAIAHYLKREKDITGTILQIKKLLEQKYSYTGGIKDVLLNNVVPLDSKVAIISNENRIYAIFNELFNDHFRELFFDEENREFTNKTSVPEIAFCEKKECNKLWKLSLDSDLHHRYAEQIRSKLNEFYQGVKTELTRSQAEGLKIALFNYYQLYKGNCPLNNEAEDFLRKQQTISTKGKVIPGTVIISKPGYQKKGIIQGVGGLGFLDYNKTSDRLLDSFTEHNALFIESVYGMINNLNKSLRDPNINSTNRNHTYLSFLINEVQKQVEEILGYKFRLFTDFPERQSDRFGESGDKDRFMNYLKKNTILDPLSYGTDVNEKIFHKYKIYRKVYNKNEDAVSIKEFLQSYISLIIQLSVMVNKQWVNYSHTEKSLTTPHDHLERVLVNHFPYAVREVLLNSMN